MDIGGTLWIIRARDLLRAVGSDALAFYNPCDCVSTRPYLRGQVNSVTKVLIVTPAPPRLRKGNRVTAVRWAGMLRQLGLRVEITQRFAGQRCDMLLAVHARKSARSIQRFAERRHDAPLIVALAGTDLYQDIHTSAAARASLEQATRLILLQPHGMRELPHRVRGKVSVIFQSARPPARTLQPLKSLFEMSVVGHLRSVKDPFRAAMAARQLPAESRVAVTHVGAALSQAMRRRADMEMARNGATDGSVKFPCGSRAS